jgi:hypothetical protein
MDPNVYKYRTDFGVRFRLARQLALLASVLVFTDAALSFQADVPEVNLQLSCAAPCRYQQGETISLKLAFTSSIPNKYQVETKNTDWPITSEDFEVLPREGTSDPVSIYSELVISFLSLNVRFQYLSTDPVIMSEDLNQHIRFDQPGHYRVQAISNRVSIAKEQTISPVSPPTKSNTVEIEIIPANPEWQRTQLEWIRNTLDSVPISMLYLQVDAVRALCDMGTEAATREMIRRSIHDDYHYYLYLNGLIRSRYRTAALIEMDKLLQAPDVPINIYFLQLVNFISIEPSHDRADFNKKYQDIRRILIKKLIESLPQKTNSARSITADTILNSGGYDLDERSRRAIEESLGRR